MPHINSPIGRTTDTFRTRSEASIHDPEHKTAVLPARLLDFIAAPARAAEMGRAGRRRVLELFQESAAVERQWVEYQRLMREKGLGA